MRTSPCSFISGNICLEYFRCSAAVPGHPAGVGQRHDHRVPQEAVGHNA